MDHENSVSNAPLKGKSDRILIVTLAVMAANLRACITCVGSLVPLIREELGMAYSVYSYPTLYPGSGMFTIYAGTSPENAKKVLGQIAGEIRLLLDKGIAEEEFAQAREQLKGGYILGLESASSRMASIGRSKLLLNRAQDENEILARIAKVRRDDVLDIARKMLGQTCSVALVGRKAEKLDARAAMGIG